ncbi:MAG: 3-deoxy-manno-octulosonate cytidylyltransferase [Planctomycetota bacterium]
MGHPPPPKATAIIPARLGSTRFPGKVLAADTGRPMVVHVCEQASKAESVDRVVVATDAEEVASAVREHGFEAVLTSAEHATGTSRVAEAASLLKLGLQACVINVQGDEPEIESDAIDGVLTRFHPMALECYTVATTINDPSASSSPSVVKVVTTTPNEKGYRRALYFSRSSIPFHRDRESVGDAVAGTLRHVGIYAYTPATLNELRTLSPTPLEQAEQLEQLRWLEHGLPIAVAIRESSHTGIDTPEQYAAFVERHRARQTP